jgi:hypothetical protein
MVCFGRVFGVQSSGIYSVIKFWNSNSLGVEKYHWLNSAINFSESQEESICNWQVKFPKAFIDKGLRIL